MSIVLLFLIDQHRAAHMAFVAIYEKMVYLIKELPRLHGHLGTLGVHACLNPLKDDPFIINVSNMKQKVSSFSLLISMVIELQKEFVTYQKCSIYYKRRFHFIEF